MFPRRRNPTSQPKVYFNILCPLRRIEMCSVVNIKSILCIVSMPHWRYSVSEYTKNSKRINFSFTALTHIQMEFILACTSSVHSNVVQPPRISLREATRRSSRKNLFNHELSFDTKSNQHC